MISSWREAIFVSFDTETSGKYPLADEVCEIAAVKWQGGRVVDEFQSFIKVSRPMSNEVIQIHHITNEMLIGAPNAEQVIGQFIKFIDDSYMIAHHAPFDMGFLAPLIEKARLPLPKNNVFCSSLLARKAFKESPNHKLQTLIQFFKLPQGQAHRALYDARACLEVGFKVFEKIEALKAERTQEPLGIEEIFAYQEAKLPWLDYSVAALKSHPIYAELVRALEERSEVQIVYAGGSRPGQARTVTPIGLVRNPLDDYLVAFEVAVEVPKRYFLNKITAARI
jgi:DNA polymerase-3 subunit epsilon